MGFGLKELNKEEVSEEEEKKWSKAFKEHDKDDSGDISVKELCKACSKLLNLKFNTGATQIIMNMADLDGTGTLNKKEFIYFVSYLFHLKTHFYKISQGKESVSRKELDKMLKKLKYKFSSGQLKTLEKLVDKNDSGTIEVEEFILLGVFLRSANIQVCLADKNMDGKISEAEMISHLKKMGLNMEEAKAKMLFKQLDSDNNGTLSPEEFSILAAMVYLDN